MTLALLDCPTGLAGNMLLAALLDLGVPEEVIHQPLIQLGLEGQYRLKWESSIPTTELGIFREIGPTSNSNACWPINLLLCKQGLVFHKRGLRFTVIKCAFRSNRNT